VQYPSIFGAPHQFQNSAKNKTIPEYIRFYVEGGTFFHTRNLSADWVGENEDKIQMMTFEWCGQKRPHPTN